MAETRAKGTGERCTWCGREVEAGDGFRAGEVPGARRAAFCRLEHLVPWSIQGAHWEPGAIEDRQPHDLGASIEACAQCGRRLSDVYVLLVRHRGEHRIPDAFCSVDHMADWAKAGGRWR